MHGLLGLHKHWWTSQKAIKVPCKVVNIRNLLDPGLVVSHGVTCFNDEIHWLMWHFIVYLEYIPSNLYCNFDFEKRYESAVKSLGNSAVPHSKFDTEMITCQLYLWNCNIQLISSRVFNILFKKVLENQMEQGCMWNFAIWM